MHRFSPGEYLRKQVFHRLLESPAFAKPAEGLDHGELTSPEWTEAISGE